MASPAIVSDRKAIYSDSKYVESFAFDVATYAGQYVGMTKILRLKYIASTFLHLRNEAMTILIKEVSAGLNAELYAEICELAKAYDMPNAIIYDEEWVRKVSQEKRRRIEIASTELSQAKSSSNKEAIRRGYMEMGNLHMEHYDMLEAIKAFQHARDYAGKAEHHIETSFKVAACYMNLGNHRQAANAITSIADNAESPLAKAQAKALQGLCWMLDGSYIYAAHAFLELDGSILRNQFNHVLATKDIALYGSLCALATLDPPKIKQSVLDSKDFKHSLEQIPYARTFVQNFCTSEFGACLQLLRRKSNEMTVDMHLQLHMQPLLDRISSRALVQYCRPYLSLDLVRMSHSLDMDVENLQKELTGLIEKDLLPFRIDSARLQLHRKVQNERDAAIEKIVALSAMHATSIRQGILRLSLLQHHFGVNSNPTSSTPLDAKESEQMDHAGIMQMEAEDDVDAEGD